MTALDQSRSHQSFSAEFEVLRDVVALHGELDLASVPTMDAVIDLIATAASPVVLDLTDLAFVDSTGLTRFVRLHRQLRDHGGTLVLRHPQPRVRRVLAVSGLDTVLPVED